MSPRLVLATLAIAFLAHPSHARVWTVYHDGSGDAPTIQAAIDSATSGDGIVVYAGTYAENLTMKDGVSLFGAEGPDVTTIQAPPGGDWWIPVITVDDIGAQTMLWGFTIGDGEQRQGVTGGNCSMLIKGNRFYRNIPSHEDFFGAAIQLSGAGSPQIVENTFEDNHQYTHHGYGVPGGTLFIETSGYATIRDNEFRNNGNTWNAMDGGIAVQGNCTIEGNLLLGCQDQRAGIEVYDGDAFVIDNVIARTIGSGFPEVDPETCGIFAWVNSGWIGNNTVYGNKPDYCCTSPPPTKDWSGINTWVATGGTLHIQRNLVTRNDGGGIWVHSPERTILSCNLTWRNSGPELQGIDPDPGHVFENPFLCDPDNDNFRVVNNSPAITGTCGILGALNETCATATGVSTSPYHQSFLLRAVPNPFNPTTTIHASIPVPGRVTIAVYDVRGRRVTTLFDRTVEAGDLAVEWDATDSRGVRAASGVYFVRATASGFFTTEKIVLLK
jgi:hypothetical protein